MGMVELLQGVVSAEYRIFVVLLLLLCSLCFVTFWIVEDVFGQLISCISYGVRSDTQREIDDGENDMRLLRKRKEVSLPMVFVP